MWSGLMLIFLGVLILVQPKILIALLAGFLVASGGVLILLHWKLRRIYRAADQTASGWARFIIRF